MIAEKEESDREDVIICIKILGINERTLANEY